MNVYGYCPICGAPGVTRERRPDGNDECAKGHKYPSRQATIAPHPPMSPPEHETPLRAPWDDKVDEEKNGDYAVYVAWEEWILDGPAGDGIGELDMTDRIQVFGVMVDLLPVVPREIAARDQAATAGQGTLAICGYCGVRLPGHPSGPEPHRKECPIVDAAQKAPCPADAAGGQVCPMCSHRTLRKDTACPHGRCLQCATCGYVDVCYLP
jgi:hypothetical protein